MFSRRFGRLESGIQFDCYGSGNISSKAPSRVAWPFEWFTAADWFSLKPSLCLEQSLGEGVKFIFYKRCHVDISSGFSILQGTFVCHVLYVESTSCRCVITNNYYDYIDHSFQYPVLVFFFRCNHRGIRGTEKVYTLTSGWRPLELGQAWAPGDKFPSWGDQWNIR